MVIKKRKIFLLTACLSVVILLLISFAVRNKNIIEDDHTELIQRIETAQSRSDYLLEENKNYISNVPAEYPEEVSIIANDYDVIDYSIGSIGSVNVYEYAEGLEAYGIIVNDVWLETIYSDELPGLVELYASRDDYEESEGRIYIWLDDKFIMQGILVNSYFLTEEAKLESFNDSSPIYSFHLNHIDLLGEPQSQFTDELIFKPDSVENIQMDFYFDRGVAFSSSNIFIFSPSVNYLEDFAREAGFQILRQRL